MYNNNRYHDLFVELRKKKMRESDARRRGELSLMKRLNDLQVDITIQKTGDTSYDYINGKYRD